LRAHTQAAPAPLTRPGMAQEVPAPTQSTSPEPRHPLSAQGRIAARPERTERAGRNERARRTTTKLLAPPLASTSEMRRIIAEAALAATEGGK